MHPSGSVPTSNSTVKLTPDDAQELAQIVTVLWGSTERGHSAGSSFSRWSAPFVFSDAEPTALKQETGGKCIAELASALIHRLIVFSGPCSVITSVQAYMLKNLLCECSSVHQFHDLTEDKCRKILIKAICNILEKCKDRPTIRVVTLNKTQLVDKAMEASETENSSENVVVGEEQMESSLNYVDESDVNNPEIEITLNEFHERLVINDFQAIEDVEKFYSENYDILSSRFGILLYLYSVLFTKSAENLINEIGDISEPLICHTFGYGSQSLINLLLTGKAVQHVFDNVQDIGGMKLQGVEKQSDIGFVTLMETLRYIAVGSYYKNPKYPIWVVGSETHLTVLFSNEKSLVSPETPAEHARRIFSKYDTENSSKFDILALWQMKFDFILSCSF